MHKTKLFISYLAIFTLVFLFDFTLHGIILKSIYAQTPQIWRPESSMQNYIPWSIFCQALTCLIITIFYFQKHENKGWTEGLKFGAIVGLVVGVTNASFYAYMPISFILATAWFLGSTIEFSLVSILLSLINQQKS
jgi:hypothetical protein